MRRSIFFASVIFCLYFSQLLCYAKRCALFFNFMYFPVEKKNGTFGDVWLG